MNQSSKRSCELPGVAKDSKPDLSASKSKEECRSLIRGPNQCGSFLLGDEKVFGDEDETLSQAL